MFLLSLHVEIPIQPNLDYCGELLAYNGTAISSSFLSNYFAKAWTTSGKYRKPNLLPLDKFRPENVLKFAHFRLKVTLFEDHSCWRSQPRLAVRKIELLPATKHFVELATGSLAGFSKTSLPWKIPLG
jgi:hypothetical protein